MAYLTQATRLGSLSLVLLLGCGGETAKHNEQQSSMAGTSGAASTRKSDAAGATAVAVTPSSGGTTGPNVPSAGGAPSATSNEPPSAGRGGTNVIANAGSGNAQAIAGAPVSIGFDGLPTVGTTVANATPGGPTGTITGVITEGDGYYLLFVQYDPKWTCPTNAVVDARHAASSARTAAVSSNIGLTPSDCHTFASLRRTELKAENLANLADQRAQLVIANCTQDTEYWCIDASGKRVDEELCWAYEGTGDPPPGNTTDPPAADGSAASSYSTTNTQVADVDEPDYVKNDGNTIYVLGSDGLHIIDAWPAPDAHELARVTLPGEPRRLVLSDNRLVVYSRIRASSSVGVGSSNPSDQGCLYGNGCRFTSDGGSTVVIVLDVSTPAQPTELVRYTMSGGYVAARRVGSAVYTVVHDAGAPQVPGTEYTLSASSFEELDAAFAARATANDALTDAQSDDYFVPWVQTTTPAGVASTDSDCAKALISADAQGGSFVTLTAFDLTQLQPPKRTVLGSNPGFVYASTEALFLAVDQVPEPTSTNSYSYYGNAATTTLIHKFALQGVEASYRGSAALPGRVLNQFAMDERNGVLRVASTAGWVPDPNVVSYLTTLAESAGALTQLGQVGGIAPSEDIRSVRFDEDRGFVVTFKKTDPLFVFDLSDPAAPHVLGELKIPGFSTYMHRLDANHLLAVGFDADDQGSFAYFNGIQIQIFDVTDLTQPQLLHKKVIGTRGSGSEALTNHLAFNYFAPKKLLALPITVCEGGGNGTFGDELTFTGLMTFDVSVESGITEHGRLPFLDPTMSVAGQSCQHWWTDTTSLVKRSIFMDDWVYGLSDAQLRVANLVSMEAPVAVVKIGQ